MTAWDQATNIHSLGRQLDYVHHQAIDPADLAIAGINMLTAVEFVSQQAGHVVVDHLKMPELTNSNMQAANV